MVVIKGSSRVSSSAEYVRADLNEGFARRLILESASADVRDRGPRQQVVKVAVARLIGELVAHAVLAQHLRSVGRTYHASGTQSMQSLVCTQVAGQVAVLRER